MFTLAIFYAPMLELGIYTPAASSLAVAHNTMPPKFSCKNGGNKKRATCKS